MDSVVSDRGDRLPAPDRPRWFPARPSRCASSRADRDLWTGWAVVNNLQALSTPSACRRWGFPSHVAHVAPAHSSCSPVSERCCSSLSCSGGALDVGAAAALARRPSRSSRRPVDARSPDGARGPGDPQERSELDDLATRRTGLDRPRGDGPARRDHRRRGAPATSIEPSPGDGRDVRGERRLPQLLRLARGRAGPDAGDARSPARTLCAGSTGVPVARTADTFFDPFVNVRLGTTYLKPSSSRPLRQLATSPLALAAYNWGPGAHRSPAWRRGRGAAEGVSSSLVMEAHAIVQVEVEPFLIA